jgi:hypothetical protein
MASRLSSKTFLQVLHYDGLFLFIFFRRNGQLPSVLACSRITQRVGGHVDPRLSALP